MSTWSKVVSHLATRCLCLGICLTRCQPYPKIWPNVNLTQSSITLGYKMSLPEGYVWPNFNLTQSRFTLGHKMSLPGDMSDQCQPELKIWPNVNLTQSSITLGHKMSLPVDMSDQMTPQPKVVSHLATRCLCLGVCLTKCKPDPR